MTRHIARLALTALAAAVAAPVGVVLGTWIGSVWR